MAVDAICCACGFLGSRWAIWKISHNVRPVSNGQSRKKNTSLASSTHGIYCSLLIDYLLSLSSGVNVPCLGNKNSLERQLPQVKLCSFPDRSLLSISIQTLSIYLGKLKQLFLNVGAVLAQTRAGDLLLSYLKGSKDEFKMTVARKRYLNLKEITYILSRLKSVCCVSIVYET